MEVFISTTQPKDKPWIKNYYYGAKDGTGEHGHLTLSGAPVIGSSNLILDDLGVIGKQEQLTLIGAGIKDIWYLRNINGKEIVKNGEVVKVN